MWRGVEEREVLALPLTVRVLLRVRFVALGGKFRKPQTPNPKPQTPNPKPQTPNPKADAVNGEQPHHLFEILS